WGGSRVYLTLIFGPQPTPHFGKQSMAPSALALVVAAAALHAAWNVLTKVSERPFLFVWSSLLVASVLFFPVAARVVYAYEGLPTASLPWLAASVAIHTVYYVSLGRGYLSGDFSVV